MSEANTVNKTEIFKTRSRISTLVVAKQGGNSFLQIRTALCSMGLTHISYAQSHVNALERVHSRNYELIIFEAHGIDMPTVDFVTQAAAVDPNTVMIAISNQPKIDDIFSLLRAGARGFIVPPFSLDAFESTIMRAAEGPAFSQHVLDAEDRNAALVGVVLNNFYRLTVRMRQARNFPTAAREVERYRASFLESLEMACIFCEDGDAVTLMVRIQEECASRSEQASSRLGRMRQKLAKRREKGAPETAVIVPAV